MTALTLNPFMEDAMRCCLLTDIPNISAAVSEITLHDVLRLCQAGRLAQSSATAPPVTNRVDHYRSEADLRSLWQQWDSAAEPANSLTVILHLGKFLRSNLSGLISRRHRAHRLIIVPHLGRWPGTDSFGDLALAAGSLGWDAIELHRQSPTAEDDALGNPAAGGSLRIAAPAAVW